MAQYCSSLWGFRHCASSSLSGVPFGSTQSNSFKCFILSASAEDILGTLFYVLAYSMSCFSIV